MKKVTLSLALLLSTVTLKAAEDFALHPRHHQFLIKSSHELAKKLNELLEDPVIVKAIKERNIPTLHRYGFYVRPNQTEGSLHLEYRTKLGDVIIYHGADEYADLHEKLTKKIPVTLYRMPDEEENSPTSYLILDIREPIVISSGYGTMFKNLFIMAMVSASAYGVYHLSEQIDELKQELCSVSEIMTRFQNEQSEEI